MPGYLHPKIWKHAAVRRLEAADRYIVSRFTDACDPFGRIELDYEDLAEHCEVVDEDDVRDLVMRLAAGKRPFLHVYAGGKFACLHGFDAWASATYLRDRGRPKYPEPPRDVWEAAKCSPVHRHNRDGAEKPG